jgi:hypothetical protein
MRKVGRAILLFCALSGSVRTLAGDDRGGDKEAAQAPRGYSSPQEAFQARRAAIARRDWRTAFSSMTPETQDQAVVEIAWAWLWLGASRNSPHERPWCRGYPPSWPGDRWEVLDSDGGTPWDKLGKAVREATIARVRTMTKTHGLELQKFQAEFNKRYDLGRGWDKIVAERREREIAGIKAQFKKRPEVREEFEKLFKEHPEYFGTGVTVRDACERLRPGLLDPDIELESRVILSQLIDKAGFYEEAMELLKPRVVEPGEEDHAFGDLQGVTVSGDTARGWVVCHSEIHMNGVLEPIKPGRVLCCFRRLDGRWFNDNREADLTRYDGPRDRD